MLTTELDGVIVIDKPSGCTSQQAVNHVKHRLADEAGIAAKKLKVGHAGTLDPMATGVLVIGVGRATRLLGFISGHDKQYLATVRLGQSTTTDDAEGEPLAEPVDVSMILTGHAAPVGGTEDCATGAMGSIVQDAMAALTGEIEQVPSSVSAIKVAGKRAYALVRAGAQVELKPRRVTVSLFRMLYAADEPPYVDLGVLVECSSGTYIRALARDLGAKLGVGGHLTSLRRYRVGKFAVDAAVPLDDADWAHVTPLDDIAPRLFTTVTVSETQAADVAHGRALSVAVSDDPTAVMGPAGEFLALYQPDGTRSVPLAVFVDGAVA